MNTPQHRLSPNTGEWLGRRFCGETLLFVSSEEATVAAMHRETAFAWDEGTDRMLLELRKNGTFFGIIAERIGCSAAAARARHRRMVMPPDELASLRKRERDRERNRVHSESIASTMIVPQYVMDDRDRRLSFASRDLTAAFFGDPPPGYSALDKRQPCVTHAPSRFVS